MPRDLRGRLTQTSEVRQLKHALAITYGVLGIVTAALVAVAAKGGGCL